MCNFSRQSTLLPPLMLSSLMTVAWMSFAIDIVSAADPPQMETKPAVEGPIEAATDAPGNESVAPPSNKRPTERQKKAYSGLAALLGIVITGMALAVLICLWGARLRRQIRQPLPNTRIASQDFWFLKPPKPSVTSSSLPEAHLPLHDEDSNSKS